jgi:prolyl-tRNA synthetase
MAPFPVAVVPLNAHRSERVREAADALYERLREAGLDPLLDDRDERPGVKFADMELLGIPHRVVVGEKSLEAGAVEYRGRTDAEAVSVPLDEIVDLLRGKLGA